MAVADALQWIMQKKMEYLMNTTTLMTSSQWEKVGQTSAAGTLP